MGAADNSFTVTEKTTPWFTTTLVDQAKVAIPAGTLTLLELTYYDRATGTIINGRNAQNVLNANGVTVDVNGLLTWKMVEAETAVLSPPGPEAHVAELRWQWTAGTTQTGRAVLVFLVRDLTKAT